MAAYTIYYTSTGEVLSTKDVPDEYHLLLNTPEGCSAISGRIEANHYVVDGEPVAMPPQPSLAHVFDYTLKDWVDPRSLEELKSQKWAEIKAARENSEWGGFTWDGSGFDSDPSSQMKIMGAAQMTAINPALSLEWTLADNSVRTLDTTQMQNVGLALGAHISACHARARDLRALIDSAADAETVALVEW